MVDDDPYQARLYVNALLDAGFEVTFVANVDDALELARTSVYDIVVTDVMMHPGQHFDMLDTMGGYTTGIALARELLDLCPGVPIVALTNLVEAGAEAWFSCHEHCAYWRKRDIYPTELPARLRSLLEIHNEA